MAAVDETPHEQIDRCLHAWRQGDCVLGEHWFIFRVSADAPLTEAATAAAAEGSDAAESEVVGFMVATQTCDIVRKCIERPFVEVCPLIEVDAPTLREIERGRRPNFAFIAGTAEQRLVADLDRVMTVEKAVLLGWDRQVGCGDDHDARRLAEALARKRARAAFPDDFVRFASALTSRMSSKHDNKNDEGRALRSLREIRVRAAPSWDAEKVEIMFWFIRNDDEPRFEEHGWDHYLAAWLKRIEPSGRFVADGLVQTLEQLNAREYVESDRLDLDHLSSRES